MNARLLVCAAATLLVAACSETPPADPAEAEQEVLAIADAQVELMLEQNPLVGYLMGVAERHDTWPDISEEAQASGEQRADALLARLRALPVGVFGDSQLAVLRAQLTEALEGAVGTRVCRSELTSVNHFGGGAHSLIDRVARLQPVGTPELREQAVARWRAMAHYVHDDIANLRRGVALGYTAPKSPTRRVISQVEGFLAMGEEQSPLYAPLRQDDDADFQAAMREVIDNEVRPAFQAYHDYLRDEYLPEAREELALSANPDGVACWEALYRSYTTMHRTGQEVFDIGSAAVAQNTANVVELGTAEYGTSDFEEIISRTVDNPANQFTSAEELRGLYDETVAAGRAAMPSAFSSIPEQDVVVEPYPDNVAGTGMAESYERATGDVPAMFRYDPVAWPDRTRGSATRTALHETYPGHHMQIAYTTGLEYAHPIQALLGNGAFVEGWARYSEGLAEEIGLMESVYAQIERRAWPARGMVGDAGLHVFGWTNEQTAQYFAQSGMSDDEAVEMLDRIAVIPSQLTSYDSGGLEIFALRRQAEEAMGADFDLREFHTRVLEAGIIPMPLLRQRIEAWIEGR